MSSAIALGRFCYPRRRHRDMLFFGTSGLPDYFPLMANLMEENGQTQFLHGQIFTNRKLNRIKTDPLFKFNLE